MRQGILIVVLLATGCGGSPTSPTGERERVSWTVNGESFAGTSNGMGALRAGSNLSLTGADCGRGGIFSIMIRAANLSAGGTYPVGELDGTASVNWTPDARTSAAANEAWNAPGISRVVNNVIVRGGSGTVTISSISGDWVSGAFSVEVVPNPSNRDTGMKTLQGSFELSFRERTIC